MPGDLYTLSLQNKMFRPCLGVYLQTLDADFCGQGAEGFFCPLQMSLHCGIMQEHPRIILHISFFVLFSCRTSPASSHFCTNQSSKQ